MVRCCKDVVGELRDISAFEMCFLLVDYCWTTFLSSFSIFVLFSGMLRPFTLCEIMVGDFSRREYAMLWLE